MDGVYCPVTIAVDDLRSHGRIVFWRGPNKRYNGDRVFSILTDDVEHRITELLTLGCTITHGDGIELHIPNSPTVWDKLPIIFTELPMDLYHERMQYCRISVTPADHGTSLARRLRSYEGWLPVPYEMPSSCATEFLDHQRRMFMHHLLLNHSADLSDPGTGKTKPMLHALDWLMTDALTRRLWLNQWRQDIGSGSNQDLIAWATWAAEVFDRNPVARCAMVVCPGSVCYKWLKEVVDNIPHRRAVVLQGSAAKRRELLHGDYDIFIINYEGLLVLRHELAQWVERSRAPMTHDRGHGPIVVLDEAHNIKTPTAQRTKIVWESLFDGVACRKIMSGTIKPNNAYDIHPSVTWSDPEVFHAGGRYRRMDGKGRLGMNTLFHQFCNHYFYRTGYGGYEWCLKRSMVPQLRSKIEQLSIRYAKNECLDLPEQIYDFRTFDPTPEQSILYRKALTEFVVWLREESEDCRINQKPVMIANVLVRLLRLRQISDGFIGEGEDLHAIKPNPKLAALHQVLEDIGADHQIIIGASFHYSTFAIYHDLVKKWGNERVVTFYNGADALANWEPLPMIRRQELCDRIAAPGSPIRYVVTSPSLTAEGINLQSACYMVRYSRSFNMAQEVQFEGRVHRVGQKNRVTYIDLRLHMDGCDLLIDDVIARRVDKKISLLSALVDGLGIKLHSLIEVDDDTAGA